MSDIAEPDETTPDVVLSDDTTSADSVVDPAALAAAVRARRVGRRHPAPEGRGRLVLIAAACVAGVLLIAAVADAAVSAGRIHPGVHVGDVAVGSLTPAAAQAKIASAFGLRFKSPVTASWGSTTWKLTGVELGARIDAAASVRRAMAVGRTGSLWEMVGDRLTATFSGMAAPAKIEGDPVKTDLVLERIDRMVQVPAQDASISVSGTEVHFASAKPGRRIARALTASRILAAFLTDDRRAVVSVEVLKVSVTDADARQAFADARQLVAGPVTIVYGAARRIVPQTGVASMVAFHSEPVDKPAVELAAPSTAGVVTTPTTEPTSGARPARCVLVAGFDPARLGTLVAPLVKGVGRPARDAAFVAANGGVTIRPSQAGLGADVASLASDLAASCLKGTRRASVRLVTTQPRITTAAARAMGITSRLGTFTTDYSSGNKPRVNNVHLLASALDDKLVPPGAVFSFNQTAGERTAAKGYQEANAIVDGKLVPQLGGGVCQVGTTMFNAIFLAGLPVVERINHSFYISHYPTGRDATVSWGGPDLRFRNDTKHWILIRTQFTDSTLTISLYGTDQGYDVRYTTGPFTNIVPFHTTEVKDPTLPVGQRVAQDAGENGCDVTVVRTVYRGGQVVRTDTFVSHYQPKEATVRVGTLNPAKPGTSTVSTKKKP